MAYMGGLGFDPTSIIAAAVPSILGSGGSSGGAMPASGVTVSPKITAQISPQISPIFQQQFQPSNSPISAGTMQTLPAVGETAFPVDNVGMPASFPATTPTNAPIASELTQNQKYLLLGGAALVLLIVLMKKRGA